MNAYTIRTIAKEALKVVYAIPRQRASRRTADLYASLDMDVSKTSPKGSATIRRWISKKVSGSEDVDFLGHIRMKYIPSPLGCVAALGSHHAHFERELARRGMAREVHCYELSLGAIEKAKRLCEEQDITNVMFFKQDLNKPSFARDHYDCVFAVKSLHHVENLEGLFEAVRGVLGKGGYLFADDFFGPQRLQWTDEQLRITNEILELLPDELKVDLGSFRPNVFGERKRSSVEENIAIDPSEAVRSDEILPVMKNYFEIVDCIDYGGNVYLNLFSKIMGNFRDDHPLSQVIIRLILYIEDLALREGILKDSDFKFVVARAR